ncbi:MAG: hypothetical protein RL215_1989, partial [Planctomycetota bacterium]
AMDELHIDFEGRDGGEEDQAEGNLESFVCEEPVFDLDEPEAVEEEWDDENERADDEVQHECGRIAEESALEHAGSVLWCGAGIGGLLLWALFEECANGSLNTRRIEALITHLLPEAAGSFAMGAEVIVAASEAAFEKFGSES